MPSTLQVTFTVDIVGLVFPTVNEVAGTAIRQKRSNEVSPINAVYKTTATLSVKLSALDGQRNGVEQLRNALSFVVYT